jgi:hypothetical protein
MNILNFFSKSKNTRKNTESAAPTLQMKDLYETKDYESFFENYSKELENKYTLIDLNSFLNITQGLLVSLYFKKSEQEVRSLEQKLRPENVQIYNEQEVNLNKIFKFFHFFGSTRTHELKKLYTTWAQEFYNEHQKPLFEISNKNGYTVSPEFLDYIYNKIIKQ